MRTKRILRDGDDVAQLRDDKRAAGPFLHCPQDDMARPTAPLRVSGERARSVHSARKCARETNQPASLVVVLGAMGLAGSRIGVASARAECGAPT